MSNDRLSSPFQGTLASYIEKFLEEKRACGYRYVEGNRLLRHFDAFLSAQGLTRTELPRALVKKWLSKRTHESPRTHQQRVSVIRHFSEFLLRLGVPAYVPDSTVGFRVQESFVPRILTREQTRTLLQATDRLVPTGRSPLRHLIMPEVFRLLYGCGLRVGEVLNLRVRDVDLDQGILTVRQGKFGKDRLVPPAPSLISRLETYAASFGKRRPDAFFFPAPNGGPYSLRTIYGLFRKLLVECGIPHEGRSKGPRVHDLRHGFAVHTLLRWYREGADLDAKLPFLATYLGHQDLSGTQRYLHLTAECFPEITTRVDAAFGDVIPRRAEQ
jgi:integrase/recombinase XerD